MDNINYQMNPTSEKKYLWTSIICAILYTITSLYHDIIIIVSLYVYIYV